MTFSKHYQSFFIKPYSDSIGKVFDIIYLPMYGVTAPDLRTTNGNTYVIADLIDDSSVIELFNEWLTSLGYKHHLTEEYKKDFEEQRKKI